MSMTEKWIQRNKQADFDILSKSAGIDKVTAKIIVNRGVADMKSFNAYVTPELTAVSDPYLLKDMEKAVKILQEKINEGKSIRIVGDYDVDGVMSTYILYKGLSRLGAANLSYEIPDRILDGYGINVSIIDAAAKDKVDTILTCDNGIAALTQIAHAKELGMTVIVTDHHEIFYEEKDGVKEEKLPPADAVIDPKQSACNYPFDGLCGAGVAWQLIRAMYKNLGRSVSEADEFLDMVSLATVCDVMDLLSENRCIVKNGLKAIENTKNIGLRALIRATGMEGKSISAYSIGFVIGPCSNASGRLDSAIEGLKLLLSEDTMSADAVAAKLVALNEERKEMTANNVAVAIEQAEGLIEKGHKVLVVYLPECHESIAGIVAGKVRERFYKPAIVLTKGESTIKGSGRSTDEYNMFENLVKVKEHFSKFGGHPLAAGLSLLSDDADEVESLREAINSCCTLSEDDQIPKYYFDAVLPLSYHSLALAEEFERLEPYGKGNPKPLFATKNVEISGVRVLGKNNNVIRLTLKEERIGRSYTGVIFGDADIFLGDVAASFGDDIMEDILEGRGSIFADLMYYPDINEYNGNRSLQFIIEHYRFPEQ